MAPFLSPPLHAFASFARCHFLLLLPWILCVITFAALPNRREDLFSSAHGSCFLVPCRTTRRIGSFVRNHPTCFSTPITRWIGMHGEKRLSQKREQKRN